MPASSPSITKSDPPGSAGVNRWLVLVVVCFAQFMVILDGTVVNVALPAIQTDLGFASSDLAWVVNAYTLVFGGFLLLGGRAADLFGRKRLFVAGVALFSIASLLDGLATSPGQLIVFRAIQGLAAALVSPAALSIITTTFDEGPDRTRALGVWAAIAGIGLAFGLIIGGVLVETLSWPWIFMINVPVGIAVVFAALRYVPESRIEGDHGGFDLAGAASVTGGLVALVYAIMQAGTEGWLSAPTLGFAALAVVLIAAFFAIERRHSAPLVRLGILKVRTLVAANGVVLLAVSGMFAMFFFTTLYFQQVLSYTPIEAGLAFLPFTVGIMGGSGVAQVLIKRIGLRATVVAGLVSTAAGLALMLRLTVGGSYVTEMLPSMALIAAGMGLVFVPVTLLATSGLDADDQGLASGLFNTSQQFGGALGLAVLSSLAASRTDGLLSDLGSGATRAQQLDALVSGYHVAFGVGAALMVVAALVAAALIRREDSAEVDVDEPVLVMA
ncbi:MAG: MFS transporter [Solirubrobacteraceae bacterium]|nr:MFS transporter [Solirubrobacteraceae bacterium]